MIIVKVLCHLNFNFNLKFNCYSFSNLFFLHHQNHQVLRIILSPTSPRSRKWQPGYLSLDGEDIPYGTIQGVIRKGAGQIITADGAMNGGVMNGAVNVNADASKL
jgi:hypothetical protein